MESSPAKFLVIIPNAFMLQRERELTYLCDLAPRQ
jgi:hypothetical protein